MRTSRFTRGALRASRADRQRTSFDVLEEAPGAAGFTLVAEDSLLKTHDATGLTAGAY